MNLSRVKDHQGLVTSRPFWLSCWSGRSVRAVEVNKIHAGAYLAGANLAEADLTGAVADKDTQWPLGFDAEDAGVTFK